MAEETFWTDDRLDGLRIEWEVSGRNPIYAWQAIAVFTGLREPLPDWLCDYLRECAAAVHALDFKWARLSLPDGTKPGGDPQAELFRGFGFGTGERGKPHAFVRDAQRHALSLTLIEALTAVGDGSAASLDGAAEIVAEKLHMDARTVKRHLAEKRREAAERKRIGRD